MTNKELVASKVDLNRIEVTILPATDRRYWLWLLAILGAYGLFQAVLITRLPLSYDEGLNLQVAYLIDRGYEPYTEIFTLAYPFFVWFIGKLAQFNLSPAGFKLLFLGPNLLLMANTALIARYVAGNGVSLAAAVVLAASTAFLAEAAAVLAILPAMSIATLALLFTLRYLSTRRHRWLILGGSVWGAALFVSTAALSTGIFALVMLLLFRDQSDVKPLSRRQKAGAGLVWIISAVILIALCFMVARPSIILDHLVRNEAILRNNLPLSQADNFVLIGQFAAFNLGPFLLARLLPGSTLRSNAATRLVYRDLGAAQLLLAHVAGHASTGANCDPAAALGDHCRLERYRYRAANWRPGSGLGPVTLQPAALVFRPCGGVNRPLSPDELAAL